MNCVNCNHPEIGHFAGRGRCEATLPGFITFDDQEIPASQCTCGGIYYAVTYTVNVSDLLYGRALEYRQRAKKFKNKQYNEWMATKLMSASQALGREVQVNYANPCTRRPSSHVGPCNGRPTSNCEVYD